MLKHFFQKALNYKKAKEQVFANLKVIVDALTDLELMQSWPSAQMMDAKDRMTEILHKLANLDIKWQYILNKKDAENLIGYADICKSCAPYININGLWENATTDEVRKFSYPEVDYEIVMPDLGLTTEGYCARVSADYFVQISLKCWVEVFKYQVFLNI